MPRLPDITACVERLAAKVGGQALWRVRIVHADNETNYCARCQTGGKVLAERALSRLLKASWPRHIDELA
jgi:hypothetical protein